MKKAAVNPYLPFWENIPDGEPHVFGNRIYVYGSHDRRNGTSFCQEDYVCWSASIDDLASWRYEGVIYRKNQDPMNGAPYDKELPVFDGTPGTGENLHYLYAPDVAQGPDGRYYLYYALDFVNVISVAVCDTPAGKYEFLDFVTREDRSIPEVGRWFDPAILCEKSGNYLYYGFCPPARFPGMEDLYIPGAMMVKLADDMHTILTEPVCVANGCDTAAGTDYETHPFFEASSIRHFGEWYYFVYSSLQGHELCYGMAKTPEGPFTYKGVIVSNGDIGYKGNKLPVNYTGNNHGGLVSIKDRYYIFWHRHTHGTAFSRQGCADRVEILADGTIPQTEITSCGLNNGPLQAIGKWDAYIACHLTEGDRKKVGQVVMGGPGEEIPSLPEEMPYITEEEKEEGENNLYPYIRNMRKGAAAGFKYFIFDGSAYEVSVTVRGTGVMEMVLDETEGRALGEISADAVGWTEKSMEILPIEGIHALYFRVKEGNLDFAEFSFKQPEF